MEFYLVTRSGWLLILSTKTWDAFFTGWGWMLTLWPMIPCVVADRNGHYQVLQVITKDLLLLIFRL